MIEVKGTKTQATETDPAQRYVLKNAERKSKTPAVLSVLLMGVALYLKSIFPSMAETDEAKHAPESEPKGEAEPEMTLAEAAERPPLDETSTGTVAAKGPIGGGGRVVEPLPPVEFMRIESPKVEFTPPEVEMFWQDFKIPSVYNSAANDNSGSGDIPDIDVPNDDGDTGPGDPTDPIDDDDDNDPVEPGDDDDSDPTDPGDDDDDSDPGDPTDPDEDDCPSGCGGGPCDEDPVDEPCGGDPCDDDEDPQTGNRAPRVSGPVYLRDVSGCAILAIGLTDLLRGAIDPDGDMLSVRNLTVSSGALTQEGSGWVFQGGPQLLGPVTVTYQITDGEFTVGQTAHFSVIRSFIEGTCGDDMLLGTMCADDIDGGKGDDNIDARSGNDTIAGGSGDDHIVAGAGDDTVFAGVGDDIVFGGAGNDHISGGGGDDRLLGEQGNDVVFGDAGDDYLSGGEGDDLLSGGQGDDLIEGDHGDDEIVGGSGNDHLSGGHGQDVIDGGNGNDLVHGGGGGDTILDGAGEDTVLAGAGSDLLVAAIDGDDDVYDGGEGCDTLDYSATSEGVTVDLLTTSAVGMEIGEDTITGFEIVLGGNGRDRLTGTASAETLDGNEGDDEIAGGEGDDELYGGGGDDLLADGDGKDAAYGGSGNDTFMAALDGEDDTYVGGEGCDTIDYSATTEGVTVDLSSGIACGVDIGDDTISGFEAVHGGSGDDDLHGTAAAEILAGNGGDDVLGGGDGDDVLSGGSGDDVLADGDGEDALQGGSGHDMVKAALDGDDDVYDGGEGCDTLDYSATTEGVTVDLIVGTASGLEIGEDAISGFENLVGGTGDDHFIAGAAPSILTGGEGENTFEFLHHQDLVETDSVMHEILDFKVGDRIRMSKFDLFEKICEEFQDQFQTIYGDNLEANDIPIRFRHDRADDMQRTFIEADFDDDDIYETTITLQGHHVLVIVENA